MKHLQVLLTCFYFQQEEKFWGVYTVVVLLLCFLQIASYLKDNSNEEITVVSAVVGYHQ